LLAGTTQATRIFTGSALAPEQSPRMVRMNNMVRNTSIYPPFFLTQQTFAPAARGSGVKRPEFKRFGAAASEAAAIPHKGLVKGSCIKGSCWSVRLQRRTVIANKGFDHHERKLARPSLTKLGNNFVELRRMRQNPPSF
jgi:hypothetical protein